MKKLILLSILSISLCANSVKVVTANDIVTLYTNYKNQKERLIEREIIKPRLKNFSEKLFFSILKSKDKERETAVAYSAILVLLLHKGESFSLPTKYEHLSAKISKEIMLIINAKKRATSPILGVLIDYTLFKVPSEYKNNSDYFRAMKFAQTMPFMVNPSSFTKVDKKTSKRLLQTALNLKKAIISSRELTHLYRHITENLNDFIGKEDDFSLNDIDVSKDILQIKAILNKKSKCPIDSDIPVLLDLLDKKKQCKVSLSVRLFPSRYTIDNYILSHIPNSIRYKVSRQNLNDIIKAISPKQKVKSSFSNYKTILQRVHKEIKKSLVFQNSSYDYDLKIMETLINANHLDAFKTYYTLVQQRVCLYKRKNRILTKNLQIFADIEPNLSQTLTVMIESILMLSPLGSNKDNQILTKFKRLRDIARKKEQGIDFTKKDIMLLKSIE